MSTEGHLGINTPPIVSPQEWEAAREQLLVKEKESTRARDKLAAERRRNQEEWEDSPEDYPQTPPYDWWIWHDDHAEDVDRSGLEMVHQGRD